MILADAAVEWADVRSREDLGPYLDRARIMAETIRDASLLRGRTTLFVAGGLHVARRSRVRLDARGLPRAEITPVGWIELHHPGVSRSFQSMARPDALGVPELEGSGRPSLRGTAAGGPGAIPADRTTTLRNRDGSRPDVYGPATLADIVDAVIVWDAADRTFPEADRSSYADDAWWAGVEPPEPGDPWPPDGSVHPGFPAIAVPGGCRFHPPVRPAIVACRRTRPPATKETP